MHWILDFDDTLAMGANTYAFQVVLPDLIDKHDLPYDDATFSAATLDAQRRANEGEDESALLDELFNKLGWPSSLQGEMMRRTFNDFQPDLFPDVRPFLAALRERGDTLYLISNNNHASDLLARQGIADAFAAIITPDSAAAPPKPHRAMWDTLQAAQRLDPANVTMIGDDPWSDGTFAQQAGIACIIVDRLQRYGTLHATMPYRFVTGLREILE